MRGALLDAFRLDLSCADAAWLSFSREDLSGEIGPACVERFGDHGLDLLAQPRNVRCR